MNTVEVLGTPGRSCILKLDVSGVTFEGSNCFFLDAVLSVVDKGASF